MCQVKKNIKLKYYELYKNLLSIDFACMSNKLGNMSNRQLTKINNWNHS